VTTNLLVSGGYAENRRIKEGISYLNKVNAWCTASSHQVRTDQIVWEHLLTYKKSASVSAAPGILVSLCGKFIPA